MWSSVGVLTTSSNICVNASATCGRMLAGRCLQVGILALRTTAKGTGGVRAEWAGAETVRGFSDHSLPRASMRGPVERLRLSRWIRTLGGGWARSSGSVRSMSESEGESSSSWPRNVELVAFGDPCGMSSCIRASSPGGWLSAANRSSPCAESPVKVGCDAAWEEVSSSRDGASGEVWGPGLDSTSPQDNRLSPLPSLRCWL